MSNKELFGQQNAQNGESNADLYRYKRRKWKTNTMKKVKDLIKEKKEIHSENENEITKKKFTVS